MDYAKQRDENDMKQIQQFVDKFDIEDDDLFKKETEDYMASTRMPKDQFISYLNTVKSSLSDKSTTCY